MLHIGGSRSRAQATFRSGSEATEFTLDVSLVQAQRLARHLFDEVDITALIWRDAEERICGGSLEEFFPMDEGNASDAWRDWISENGISLEEYEAQRAEEREEERDYAKFEALRKKSFDSS